MERRHRGELRSRSERLFAFDDLAAVQAALDRLAGREEPVVAALARAPGSREIRYVQLLGGAEMPAVPAAEPDHVAELRAMIEALSERVRALEERRG